MAAMTSVLRGEGVSEDKVIEAKAGEHQGDKARLMPKLIDPGRLYNGLSTGRSLAAAVELTVKLGYGLIDPNKQRASNRGGRGCSQG